MTLDFDKMLTELENKSVTHPNLARLWREYLKIKKQKLDDALIEAKNALNNIETIDDMSWETILLLNSLSETLRENTT